MKARLKMTEKKNQEEAHVLKKRNYIKMKRRSEYIKMKIKILSQNIPLEKLSSSQLKVLLMHKKRDDDKVSIAKLKRADLLALWLEWQSRPDTIDVLEKSQDYNENNTTQCNPVIVDHHGENSVDINDERNEMVVSTL